MAKTKSEKWSEVYEVAHKRLSDAVSACEDEREQALNDRRFYSISGAAWEGAIGDQFKNRIKIDVNKVHKSVMRIVDDYRNNRIDAVFQPADGTEADDLSDACAGLYRADAQDSGAEEALDNAFEEAVGGGFGAWRLRTEYEDEYDEDNDYQRIRFESITDADRTVFFDPGAKRQDKSDATFCFVLTGMTRDAYEAEWGAVVASETPPISDSEFDWDDADLVYVAEYYTLEDHKRTVYLFSDVNGNVTKHSADEAEDDQFQIKMEASGSTLIGTRKVKERKVRKYILSGAGVLEDCGHIAGKNIPIIPVYGKRWYVDGVERFMGHVRLAKDPARLKNMQLSVLAEISAFGGVDTPIFTPEQIAGYEADWANSAVNRPAFHLLNPIEDKDGNLVPSGPIGIKTAPTIPPAMAALLELSEQDMMDILGNNQGGEEIQSNLSGRAVELIQTRLDQQSSIYISNFAKAVKRSAEVWLSMAADVYTDQERRMKVIDAQDQRDSIMLGETQLSESGLPEPKIDFSRSRMDVTVDVGPASSSRRSATVSALTQMLGLVADPQDQAVISAMAMMNMEGEGIQPVRDYFRKKMVALGLIEPNDKEIREMQEMAAQPQEPTPEAQYLMAETQKAMAEARKVEAEVEETVADTEHTIAETQKTYAQIDMDAARVRADLLQRNRQPQGL